MRGVAGLFPPVCRHIPPPGGREGARAKGRGQTGKTPANPHRTMPPRSLVTLTLTSEVVAEKSAILSAFLLRQSLKQCFGVLQVGGVKALGEPAVDWR